MNVELIATAFGVPSLLGILVLLAGRGRSWTVPLWVFLVAPWVGLAGWFVCFVAASVGDRAAPVGAGAPVMGPMGGLAALLTLIAMLGLGVLATIVALLMPPPRAWTRRSACGGLAAANLSVAWSLFLGAIDPESLPHNPSDAFTIEVPDGFQGRGGSSRTRRPARRRRGCWAAPATRCPPTACSSPQTRARFATTAASVAAA